MGGSQSREGLELSDSEYSDKEEEEQDKEEQDSENYADAKEDHGAGASAEALDEVDSRLQDLKLKYSKASPNSVKKPSVDHRNAVKLYLHIGGNTPNAKWVVSEKLCAYKFVKKLKTDDEDEYDEDELGSGEGLWVMAVGKKIKARVSGIWMGRHKIPIGNSGRRKEDELNLGLPKFIGFYWIGTQPISTLGLAKAMPSLVGGMV